MTQYTNIEYKTATNNLFPTNGVGAISALDVRTHFDNTADSLPFKTTGQTSPPTTNDDGSNTAGNGAFEIGDFWFDETNDVAYVTLDNSTGAAVWANVAAVDGNVTATGTPLDNQLAVWVDNDTLDGSASLQWDGASFLIEGTLVVDGNVTVSGDVVGGIANDIRFGFDSTPTSDQILDRIVIVRDIVIPANAAGSAGIIDTNPTSSFVITLNDDGSPIGTVTISTGGAYTFATTGGVEITIAAGSILTIDAPNSVDATAAGAAVTILGSS
tara:strand:- start:1018 stop:1830 length:813 start_codon:yes stop_codon:yes gene_type:complete